MEYKSMEEAFNAGYEKAKQDMLDALNKDKKAYDKKKPKECESPEYVKKKYIVCGETLTRLNPDYDVGHCFTATKCRDCGEWYEADRLHICRTQNSYPILTLYPRL